MTDIVGKCQVALLALSDWAVTYAPDMCSEESVALAQARILEYGTLAYIANATDQIHAAIQLLSEAEKREREARAKALEEAAKVVGALGEAFTRIGEHPDADERKANEFSQILEISSAVIRSLQSEER